MRFERHDRVLDGDGDGEVEFGLRAFFFFFFFFFFWVAILVGFGFWGGRRCVERGLWVRTLFLDGWEAVWFDG